LKEGQQNWGAGHFDSKLFDGLSAAELPRVAKDDPAKFPSAYIYSAKYDTAQSHFSWETIGPFPNALDFFGDGSLYLVDAPGHLYGHVNCLVRTDPASRWVYLGGDSCHHPDLLSGAKEIATWQTPQGGCGCVHTDKKATEMNLGRIRSLSTLKQDKVEVILAHDFGWRKANAERFFPGTL